MASTLSKAFEEARMKKKPIPSLRYDPGEPYDLCGQLYRENPFFGSQAQKARKDHKGTVITTPQDGLESPE